jgi:dihydroorotate dehydrogenase
MADLYQTLLRPVLFSGLNADPEWLHQRSLQFLGWVDRTHSQPVSQWVQTWLQQTCTLTDERLQQTIWGKVFPNPIGLAAGFDKDGVASGLWPSFGFGFAELGTVTLHGQPGNPPPRLFRLTQDRAALNRMGFNNQGAAALAQQLQRRWPEASSTLFGINLGKSKQTPLEEAAADYLGSFRLLKQWGNYFVVNVSSPNTPGLRSLQATEQLAPILQALQQENSDRLPLLVKIAPDLDWADIADVLELAQTYQLAGIVATNTTIRRDGLKTQIVKATGKSVMEEAGGVSGAPLRQRSTEIIHFIYRETQGKLPIIGVGGIFTAADAWEKIAAGASLLQVYTGWIYQGPQMMRSILAGLITRMEAEGMTSIAQAIGTAK